LRLVVERVVEIPLPTDLMDLCDLSAGDRGEYEHIPGAQVFPKLRVSALVYTCLGVSAQSCTSKPGIAHCLAAVLSPSMVSAEVICRSVYVVVKNQYLLLGQGTASSRISADLPGRLVPDCGDQYPTCAVTSRLTYEWVGTIFPDRLGLSLLHG